MGTAAATTLAEAEHLLADGAFDRAEAVLKALVAEAPEEAAAWHYLGLLRLERGAHQGAAECFIQCLQHDAFDKKALEGLWRAYEALGVLHLLAPLLEDLSKSRPEDATYRQLLTKAQTAGQPAEEPPAPAPAAWSEEAFAREVTTRFKGLLETASAQLQSGDLPAGAVSLWRSALATAYADPAIVQALTDVYRQAQDIPALKELWKRAAVAAFERGDLDAFLQHAYVSIYAEQMFSKQAQYAYATIDPDLNTYIRLAARAHALQPWVEERRARPEAKRARRLRVGFVLEGFSQTQAPSRAYLPMAEHHDPERFELFFYSRYSLGEPLAVRERYRDTAAFFEAHGARVRTPERPLAAAQQVEALARQIVADEVDVLVFQSLYFVPVYHLLAALRPAPFQALIEHQQPEHTRAVDLIFTTRKAGLESAVETAPIPIMHARAPRGTAVPRAALGLPEDALVLVSANRDVRYRQADFWAQVLAVLERHPNAYFLALGLSDATPFLGTRADLKARVVTPGFRTDVMDCLAAADIYVDLFPSGGGSSMVEAMFAGLPVVCFEQDFSTPYATNNETLSEYVGEPGLIVPRGRTDQWQQLMDRLIRDEAFRAKMGEAMHRRTQAFDPGTVSRRFFDTLAEAYGRKAASTSKA